MCTYICAHCRWKEATQCMNTGKIILPKINLILCVFFRMHIYRECIHISILDDHCCCRCCQVFFSYFFFAFWASKCLLECMLFRRCFDFFFALFQIYMKYQLHCFLLLLFYINVQNFSYSPIRVFFFFQKMFIFCYHRFVSKIVCTQTHTHSLHLF